MKSIYTVGTDGLLIDQHWCILIKRFIWWHMSYMLFVHVKTLHSLQILKAPQQRMQKSRYKMPLCSCWRGHILLVQPRVKIKPNTINTMHFFEVDMLLHRYTPLHFHLILHLTMSQPELKTLCNSPKRCRLIRADMGALAEACGLSKHRGSKIAATDSNHERPYHPVQLGSNLAL